MIPDPADHRTSADTILLTHSKIFRDGSEEPEELREKRKHTGLQIFLEECERPRKRLKPRPHIGEHPLTADESHGEVTDDDEPRQPALRSQSEEV